MANSSQARRAIRLSRPDQEKFFTVMVVFSHRTFRWSLPRKMLFRVLAAAAGVWLLAMIGSAYGLWATKKIMSFPTLQQETSAQSKQLKQSLGQAEELEGEVAIIRNELANLMQALNSKDAAIPQPAPTGRKGKRGKGNKSQDSQGPKKGDRVSPPPANTGGATVLPAPESKPDSSSSGGPEELKPSAAILKNPRLARIKAELDRTALQAKTLRTKMAPIIERWNHTPSIPPTAGYISSGFGLRIHPFSRSNDEDSGLFTRHSGIDIANAIGTPIQASANGTVVAAEWIGAYGWAVIIRHSPEMETVYGHLSRIQVKAGQKVFRGDIIGKMGRSGRATGSHLHYEVRRFGQPVNPKPYMRLQNKWLSSLS